MFDDSFDSNVEKKNSGGGADAHVRETHAATANQIERHLLAHNHLSFLFEFWFARSMLLPATSVQKIQKKTNSIFLMHIRIVWYLVARFFYAALLC